MPKDFNTCPICGKTTSSRRNVVHHMLNFHPQIHTRSEAIAKLLNIEDRIVNGKFICLNCGSEINEDWVFGRFSDKYKDLVPNSCGNPICRNKISGLHRIGKSSHKFTEESHKKRQVTCLERYGVDHPMKVSENKDKMRDTCLERYGETSSMKSDKVKAKRIQNNLDKYGVEHPMKVDEIKLKQINTNLEKNGVEYAFEKSVYGVNSRIYIGLVDTGNDKIFKVGVGDVWQRWCCILKLIPNYKMIRLIESVDRQEGVRIKLEHPLHKYLEEYSIKSVPDVQGDFLQGSRLFHSSTGYTEWFNYNGYDLAVKWLEDKVRIRDVTEGFVKFSSNDPFKLVKDTISTTSSGISEEVCQWEVEERSN